MDGFKALHDIALEFENYNRQVAAELTTAVSEPFEDVVNVKVRNIKLLTSKYRLLEAKSNAATPQVQEKLKNDQTILDYEEEVSSKITKQLVVKAVTQNNTVKKLITMPSEKLAPEFVVKKEQIIEELKKFSEHEVKFAFLEKTLDMTETELMEVQRRWDQVAGQLKDTPKEQQDNGPLVQKLHVLHEKLDKIRWLIAKLATSRGDYDWSTDPHNRLRALAMARQHDNV
ncbi:uncharacterized protein LOC112051611 [Bicyclus anynana]|uniref:Uncharacterized protein LOC112051611 n=1 Tax=Bicyclus anynana TaxID=110368 RepID=A0A6J1NM60_BICAN|nr:uncharacterized protein LOC112051611 [Bicyclus anynana]